jgi:hypothetical protein
VIISQPRHRLHRFHQIPQILRGIDRKDAGHLGGRCRADARNQGVRVIAAAKRDMQRACDGAVRRECAQAGQ